MKGNFLLSTFVNLFGPDMIIMFALMIAMVVGAVLLITFLARRGTPKRTGHLPEERLRRLDDLHRTGSVSKQEYEEQRRRILGEL